jgi:hypothetical protein
MDGNSSITVHRHYGDRELLILRFVINRALKRPSALPSSDAFAGAEVSGAG